MHQGGGAPPPEIAAADLFLTPKHEEVAPISRRMSGFEELNPAAVVFTDAQALVAVTGEGREMVRGGGGAAGNRWPRQETLALLKIRYDMSAAFRDATHKGPLWEEVSRKLGELGYVRNAKKCREKFENVHKYYKRTKEGRAGSQDGKSYRFFSELEALQVGGRTVTLPPPFFTSQQVGKVHPIIMPISSAAPAAGVSFSSNLSSSTSYSDDEDTEEAVGGACGGDVALKKRKAGESGGSGGGSSRNMMAFFEGLMKQVMERQESIQNKFLEAMEKREQERMIREEAWRRQEAARAAREHELISHEHAIAASRDAAIISFIQKVTGQSIQIPPPAPAGASPTCTPTTTSTSPPAPHPLSSHPPPPPHRHQHHRHHHPPPPSTSLDLVPLRDPIEGGGFSVSGLDTVSPSRWPKAEVHALIQLRTALELKYQEVGPKSPLWEEISSEMKRIGFNRSAKRCKEKWENINKYFKKVKETNKKRSEDAKTCPYYHQLDSLYRQKLPAGAGGQKELALPAPPPREKPPEMKPSNGGLPASFFTDVSGGGGARSSTSNKVNESLSLNFGELDDDEPDSDNMVDDDEGASGGKVESDEVRKVTEYAI